MFTPEELQGAVAEVRVREAWEWEDLILETARGLTATRLVNQTHVPNKPAGHGDHYKVLPVEDYRERLLRIAGLAVAAVESYDAQMIAANAVRAAAAPPTTNDAPETIAIVPAPRPEGT